MAQHEAKALRPLRKFERSVSEKLGGHGRFCCFRLPSLYYPQKRGLPQLTCNSPLTPAMISKATTY
jgi:hypothetical protein